MEKGTIWAVNGIEGVLDFLEDLLVEVVDVEPFALFFEANKRVNESLGCQIKLVRLRYSN